ncbi:MAG: hypothetical protein KIT84_25210 [Labilithrix sp.]|nr:hypothetical protein [Labilithrix sp.]MCW5814351.1 hypothetical protein [Labilithrix sp.]
MSILSRAAVLAFGTVALLSQACTFASPTTVKYEPAEDVDGTEDATTKGAPSSGDAPSGGGAASTCSGAWAKPDLSKLTACGGGKGHCYPKNKTPGGERLVACEDADEVCVLDTILEAAGGKLKSCKVAILGDVPGACTALDVLPEAERKLAEPNLKQDACDAGEVCAPCKNPQENNADTGLCGEVGVKEEECKGGGATNEAPAKPAEPAEACCGGEGQCMAVGGDIASKMVKDTCSGEKMCAPKSSLDGGKVCNAGLLAGAGVCMGHCFNATLAKASFLLKQDVCSETESCIPCNIAKQMAGGAVPGCQ